MVLRVERICISINIRSEVILKEFKTPDIAYAFDEIKEKSEAIREYQLTLARLKANQNNCTFDYLIEALSELNHQGCPLDIEAELSGSLRNLLSKQLTKMIKDRMAEVSKLADRIKVE